MRSALIGILLAAVVVVSAGSPAPAGPVDPPQDRLVEKVRRAIDDGKSFLRREQKNGVWEIKNFENRQYRGGTVSLAVLALLTCGVNEDDRQAVKEGLDYLRTIRPSLDDNQSKTYSVSLQIMVYCLAGHPEDKDRIQENVDWLLGARIPSSGGWTYGKGENGSPYDGSNTQYALLALHEAARAGARIDPKILKDLQTFYLSKQRPDGSWAYDTRADSSMTMTTAGLCGLLITGMDVEEAGHTLRDDGSDPKCGDYKESPQVAQAVKWIANRFPAAPENTKAATKYFQTTFNNTAVLAAPFYGFYGIERTGRLTGQRFLGGHDWYRVGCRCLVNSQNADGSWSSDLGMDGNPIVATSFALLFLGKGRTPVLMTKLAYGAKDYEGWNNKHNDMRNVVEFTGRELFKKQPMAWQIFDVRNKEAANDAAIRDLTQQLLESPIVFFNGHDWAPRDKEQDLLKQYLANGGFVFAEACCGVDGAGAGFDRDFRQLMKKLYPDADLKPLDPMHPIYTASGKFVSSPRDFPLEGIEEGCKTLVVYSPKAISGYWESNDVKSDKGRKAFELAANVVAYATGLEPPRQKLDAPEIVVEKKTAIRRGFLKAAQLRHDGDWQPAPKAVHNLMSEARNAGLDVVLDPTPIHPSAETVVDYRFLYMHGRNAFTYKAAEMEHLRFDLEENGGLLFADACCGSKAFDDSFRKFMEELWAGHKDKPKLEPIPVDDELYSADLNGKRIDYVMCRRETPDGKGGEPELKQVKPSLEGVRLNGRWVVIYSRYDIGCALEHHPTPGCLGHDYASAVALGKAAVLYALKR